MSEKIKKSSVTVGADPEVFLINKETGKPLAPGAGGGFLESYVTGLDPNTDTSQVFDQSGQGAAGKPTTLDDASYWENQ